MVFLVGEDNGQSFFSSFGGQNVKFTIPLNFVDELTGSPLDHDQVKEGMKTEVEQLERLKVGSCLVEKEGRQLAKEKRLTVLTSRVL